MITKYTKRICLERYKNEEINFIITPKIDVSPFLIAATPKTAPLYEVLIQSDDFKKYDYIFIRQKPIYIFSSTQKLLNNMSGEQIFEIVVNKYESDEKFLDILDKHVKDKRMTFCFESVPNLEESTSQIPQDISNEPPNIHENAAMEA